MLDWMIQLGKRALKTTLVGAWIIVLGTWSIATSPTVKSGCRIAIERTFSAVVFLIVGAGKILGQAFPTLRKIVKEGIIGGGRYFKGQFNRNSGSMVQSIRNLLSPIEWVSAGASVIVGLFIAPISGAAMLLGTYVVFFKDPESLPLATFTGDSAGIESVLGIGTSLIVNLFNLLGSVIATLKWILSRF